MAVGSGRPPSAAARYAASRRRRGGRQLRGMGSCTRRTEVVATAAVGGYRARGVGAAGRLRPSLRRQLDTSCAVYAAARQLSPPAIVTGELEELVEITAATLRVTWPGTWHLYFNRAAQRRVVIGRRTTCLATCICVLRFSISHAVAAAGCWHARIQAPAAFLRERLASSPPRRDPGISQRSRSLPATPQPRFPAVSPYLDGIIAARTTRSWVDDGDRRDARAVSSLLHPFLAQIPFFPL